jgi:hypothetical protein
MGSNTNVKIVLHFSFLIKYSREQGTGNREQGTGNREQGTGNREQGTELKVLWCIVF